LTNVNGDNTPDINVREREEKMNGRIVVSLVRGLRK